MGQKDRPKERGDIAGLFPGGTFNKAIVGRVRQGRFSRLWRKTPIFGRYCRSGKRAKAAGRMIGVIFFERARWRTIYENPACSAGPIFGRGSAHIGR